MSKRDIILDALLALLRAGKGGTASVQDIATQAGIAKGGLYYYFRTKEDVLDALVEREYGAVIQRCVSILAKSQGNAIEKLALLLHTYRSTAMDEAMDQALHTPENAAIHQKSLAYIVRALSPLLESILMEGIQEGIMACEYPGELAEMILTVFAFLYDPGIFPWTPEEMRRKLRALTTSMELSLSMARGSLGFLVDFGSRHKSADA